MIDQHIASAFDRDLEEIQAHVMKMGGLVEDSIREGARSLKMRDEELAEKVRKADKQIDALDTKIQEECARLLALRQPIASDLRTVLTVMRVAANLERVGDYAKNMAKRTTVLVHMQPIDGASGAIKRMAKEVRLMLSDVLDAYIRRDVDLAQDVRHRDIEVDQMYNALFREFLTFMMEDPRNISSCMHLHFIAKNIERMGDHVTSIADQVIYLVTGEMPEEARPKGNSVNYNLEAQMGLERET
ncbi:phosphate signaling complex protein PhoU [Aliiroseovarius crassostreae]|uniref:Phosphate-specific transport system accessory protein PhoU n=1 Tax=Aliiroseovarius crassostreae TaxID=154981 RepID=A0A0P7IU96_9RHOB|nr:phosphate signaling complex protein PhoU [Aliiroseovarius crassostreae]KPN62456.1 PhoU family transcriptional regulator [Aliiroseovarius crassostreae]UWP90323.1 phosphate signaling complex protein PhoU [Aliiroseovarius crassostreae]UWP93466.1 phosphate signaling complex protein PhoU [Aliiroseovarius crassostreae]UWP96655.1 phosphate signaling complex protein PhoU [Aliiroseovarius crassostreae]UWP99771.1 phosphate signaling complex protein PhoU [Aliiroseovarius crassostreae]